MSRESGQPNYVLTLVVAQLLIGIGGSPLYTLGTAYIDNHVNKLKAPSYIGTNTGSFLFTIVDVVPSQLCAVSYTLLTDFRLPSNLGLYVHGSEQT